jgi:glyoxylate reductase
MSRPHVFVTRIIPEEGLEMVRAVSDAEVWQGELPPPYEIILQKIPNVDGLLCLLTDTIDRDLIHAAGESLKVISQMAVGYDNIDIPAATEHGIPIGNTPGVLTGATADFAWALLMAAARRVVEADTFTRDGHWKTWGPTLLLGPDVARATLGIVGLGRIGQAVAQRARGFQMRVIYHDIQRRPDIEETMGVEFASFDSLLQEADFVSIHTVLSDETHHLFGERQFDLMKPSGILINTARGAIVDPVALHSALRKGKIAYAAIDVTETEPILPDDPLLELENIIITPHIASASKQARTRMATMAAENLIAGLKSENLPNCVNPQVYSRST